MSKTATPPTHAPAPDPRAELLDHVFGFIAASGYAGRRLIRGSSRKAPIVYARALAVMILKREGWTVQQTAEAINRSTGAVHELGIVYGKDRDIIADLAQWGHANTDIAFGNSTRSDLIRWPLSLDRPTMDAVRIAALDLAGLPPGDWPKGRRFQINIARAAAIPVMRAIGRMSYKQVAEQFGMQTHLRPTSPAYDLLHTPAGRALAQCLFARLVAQAQYKATA